MKGLTDIPGIRVGHFSDFDAVTGCTAILCEQGAVGGVDIRGSASGTQEIDTLSPGHVTDRGHGILFAGCSAFGLESAAGEQYALRPIGDVAGAEGVDFLRAAGAAADIDAAHGALLAEDGGAAGNGVKIGDVAGANPGDVGNSLHS